MTRRSLVLGGIILIGVLTIISLVNTPIEGFFVNTGPWYNNGYFIILFIAIPIAIITFILIGLINYLFNQTIFETPTENSYNNGAYYDSNY